MSKIHFISSGIIGTPEQYQKICDSLLNQIYDNYTCLSYGNISNRKLFKELIEYHKRLNKNDLLIIQWSNPKLYDYVEFHNNIAKIKSDGESHLIDYNSHILNKKKYFYHESILLFDLIHSFLNSLDGIHIRELYNIKIPWVSITNPIYFGDEQTGFYDYIMEHDLVDIENLSFHGNFAEHISNDLKKHIQS